MGKIEMITMQKERHIIEWPKDKAHLRITRGYRIVEKPKPEPKKEKAGD